MKPGPHQHYLVRCRFCGTDVLVCGCPAPKKPQRTICETCQKRAEEAAPVDSTWKPEGDGSR